MSSGLTPKRAIAAETFAIFALLRRLASAALAPCELTPKVMLASSGRVSDRPLALTNLKLVAFVQNDATGEILQAAQVSLDAAK